jgi:hypothetical protein
MDITHVKASENTHAESFDALARSLPRQLPRRRVAGLLAAALATGVFGIGSHAEATEAKRKHRKHKHGRYYINRLSAQTSTGTGTTSIPPNCIYVCCDGTCDSWKMCMKCVKWPKGTKTTTITAD